MLPLMFAGTGSDVGKSIIVTGLCRIFKQDGYNPAPFKAQNMALNSYATPDGFEIGRAQAVQAEAAGIACETDMNPLLLKPTGDCTSQVVLNGKPIGNTSARDYFRQDGRKFLADEVHKAYDRLSSRYNPIVLEGAGSIAELNLRHLDLVNMSMARYAGARVIIVADIDRGGVFASLYGSIMLQDDYDRKLIKGVIINKFRGDISLFDSGRKIIEEICGVPVLGVVPYLNDIHIDEEDSVALEGKSSSSGTGKINAAVVKLRHISNFTDFNRLERDSRVNLYYTTSPEELLNADIVIIPGTKSTIDDLAFLRESGLAAAINDARNAGKTIFGICGGYQIMGTVISDPQGVEGKSITVQGLGLLPVSTVLTGDKVTRQVDFNFLESNKNCKGYEIHMGRTEMTPGITPLNHLSDGSPEGCIVDNRCMGSYIHGILDNDCVVDYLLSPYSEASDNGECGQDYVSWRESQYDALAAALRKHIDIDAVYRIMNGDD